MPIISTNDPTLHQRLKIFVAQNPELTIGKAVEKFTEFFLDTGLGELSEDQIEEVKQCIRRFKQDS